MIHRCRLYFVKICTENFDFAFVRYAVLIVGLVTLLLKGELKYPPAQLDVQKVFYKGHTSQFYLVASFVYIISLHTRIEPHLNPQILLTEELSPVLSAG